MARRETPSADIKDDLIRPLRAAREEKGMSISELAKASGLSPSRISGMEMGSLPRGIDALRKYARGLGLEEGHFESLWVAERSRLKKDSRAPSLFCAAPRAFEDAIEATDDFEERGSIGPEETTRPTAQLQSPAEIRREMVLLMKKADTRCPVDGQSKIIVSGALNEFDDDWNALVRRIVSINEPHSEPAWSVLQLCRADPDADDQVPKLLRLAIMSARLGPASYDVRYVRAPAQDPMSYNLVSVPGIGAVWSIHSTMEAQFGVSLGRGLPANVHRALESRCVLGTTRLVESSIRSRTRDNVRAFSHELATMEQRPGHHFLKYPALSYMLFPPESFANGTELYKREKHRIGRADLDTFVADCGIRRDAFEHNLEGYEFRQILKRSAIERWLQEGTGPREPGIWSLNERIAVLRNVIRLRNSYPKNFLLAIASDSEWERFDGGQRGGIEVDWAVKPGYGVSVIGFLPADNRKMLAEHGAIIGSPVIVEAAQAQFKEVWNTLGRESRDQNRVFAWIESQLDTLRNTHDA